MLPEENAATPTHNDAYTVGVFVSQKNVPARYSHIDFKPTDGMVTAAQRALEVRAQKPASERGMTDSGLARARDIVNRQNLSPDTVRRMLNFFVRNERYKDGDTWSEQGKGWQAWQGWGGDAGYAFARARVAQMNSADEQSGIKSSAIQLPEPLLYQDEATQQLWMDTYSAVYDETQDAEKAALAAWGTIRREQLKARLGVKSTDSGGFVCAGWAMLFSDEDNLDFDTPRTYFDNHTNTLLEYYKNAPLFYEHRFEVIGKRIKTLMYPRGIWLEHELDTTHRRYNDIVNDIENGLLTYSTDTLGHMSEAGYQASNGYLGIWPIAGCSLTKTPAEPGLGPVVITRRQFTEAVKNAAYEIVKSSVVTDAVFNSTDSDQRTRKASDTGSVEVQDNITNNKHMETDPMAQAITSQGFLDAFKSAFNLPENADMEVLKDNLSKMLLAVKMSDSDDTDSDDTENKMQDDEPITEDDMASAKAVDLDALMAAVGVDTPEALRAMLIEAMDAIDGMMAVEMSEAEQAPDASQMASYDSEAIKSAFKMVAAARKHLENKAVNAPKQRYKTASQTGAKSRNLNDFNINYGAQKPGLLSVVKDLKTGKAGSYQVGADGGVLVPARMLDIIEPLRSSLFLEKVGARFETFNGFEVVTVPKQTGDVTAYWIGEGQDATASDMTFESVTLVPKAVVGRYLISNQSLANPSFDMEARAVETIQAQLRRAIEKAGLYGTGGQQPTGLVPALPTAQVVNLAAAGRQPTIDDFADMVGAVEARNVDDDGTWNFVVSPRTKTTFRKLKDGEGRPVFSDGWVTEIEQALVGYPYHTSTQVATDVTIGGTANTSDIFFGAWSNLIVAMSNDVGINIDTNTYAKSLQTEIIVHMYADIAVTLDEAFEVRRGVTT